VHTNIVTFDGDGNGAATLQTKIQLWNRTGKGWPDVVFSEQVNDPIWMAKKPFDFAQPIDGLISKDLIAKWPAPSTAQCTVDGKQYCVQDNLAQVVLWVNKKQMDAFGYTVPKTWQEWAALGQKVATEHPGYIVGNIGDSYSHWIYLWGDQCPLQQLKGDDLLINSQDSHCTRMASLVDPLIKNGTLPPLSVFTPDFAKKYGGANDKILLMPGPAWYAQALFDQTLHVPAGQITTSAPLQWESEPVTTGQVGGGPWIISRHSKNLTAAADFVTWETTVFNPTGKDARPGYPAYGPLADEWLAAMAKNPYYAADPTPALKAAASQIWSGWSLVTYPDQPVWSNTVVTQLVAGKSLTSLMQPFGDALSQAAQAAGYAVVRQ
jgi:ABC-type glycerol-3-phosphate transport system substrate-binding protein